MASLTNDERLNLKNLMNEMDYVDNTDTIQRLRHSSKIRENIRKMEQLKEEHASLRTSSPEQFFNIVDAFSLFNIYD